MVLPNSNITPKTYKLLMIPEFQCSPWKKQDLSVKSKKTPKKQILIVLLIHYIYYTNVTNTKIILLKY